MKCVEFVSKLAAISITVIDKGFGGIREVSEMTNELVLVTVDSGEQYLFKFDDKWKIVKYSLYVE